MRRRVEAAWHSFSQVIPLGAGPTQRREMKKAFYAGAFAMFAELVNGVDDEPDVTPSDMSMMDEIHKELEEFKELMRVGGDLGV